MDVEHELLSAFECYKCHTTEMIVRPILKAYTETNEGGLLIQCAKCGEHIGIVAITEESYDMLIQGEKETLEDELNEGKN